MIYHLSNRQRKELFVRAQSIVLALPVPPYDPSDDPSNDDWKAWARSVLPDDVAAIVDKCELLELLVHPSHRYLIGAIADQQQPDGFCVTVLVLLVSIKPASPRGQMVRPQWPKEAIVDGQTLPFMQQSN